MHLIEEQEKITDLLIEWESGDCRAIDRLMPLVIDELKQIARRRLAFERPGHTWQTTEVVQELYLKLLKLKRVSLRNRKHFYGFAAKAIQRLLIDHSRLRRAEKRGGDVEALPLEGILISVPHPGIDQIALSDAIEHLERLDARQAQIVRMRLFLGLEHEEIADLIEVSSKTVKRNWRTARTWLHRRLQPIEGH